MIDSQTVTPANSAEAAEVLREANAQKQAVSFVGGGTKQNMGNLPKPATVRISTSKLDQLIEYHPEDLTVIVGAGMTLARLQEILAEHNQWLPLDPPLLQGQTLGGILATNVSGPRRLLYGTARDLLIGCEFVLADGRIGRSGGRVVKNVTGYDLHKLMIGSFGTLGLLTEVTFKVLPRPQFLGYAITHFDNAEDALVLARQTVASNISPTAIELINQRFSEVTIPGITIKIVDSRYVLQVAFDGGQIAVEEQLRAFNKLREGKGVYGSGTRPMSGTEAETPHMMENNEHSDRFQFSHPFAKYKLKISSVLTELPTFVPKIKEELVLPLDLDSHLQVRAGTGIIYLYFDNLKAENYQRAVDIIQKLRQELAAKGGSLVVEKAPTEFRALIDVFGDVGNAFAPMLALKNKLDPQHILNSGRFLKGL